MDSPLYLRPRVDGRLEQLLDQPRLLHDLVRALGSPLNVVLPDQIADNVEAFGAVHRRHHLRGEVFFAHKANRSSALLRRLAATPAGIDVASLGELQHALGAGFTPGRVMATGPKTREFLWLAARCGITVNLDSPAELDDLVALVRRHGLPPVRVLARLSAFGSAGATILSRPSRFGTPLAEADRLLARLAETRDAVELVGVAYHLDTIGVAEKAVALQACLTVLADAHRHGLRPRIVDVGGGFGVDYLADGAQWERWTSELALAVLGRRPELTWGGHGYGWRAEAGTLRGALGLYPAHRPSSGHRYLAELLDTSATGLGGRTLATLLQEHLHDLWVEPGRALVDQCGVVLARVLEVRPTAAGCHLVRLDLNAGDVSLEEHGVMMDPVLLPADPVASGDAAPHGHPVYLLGNLCLEADLITRRMVFLPTLPRTGDLLAFANTAGYFMDFSADHALHQPVARMVAAWQDAGTWRWCLDEQYWPLDTGRRPSSHESTPTTTAGRSIPGPRRQETAAA
ncbi:diaminopimelate decarboxylase [Micromonospora echinospora]|uniref:Diaminopimelate decarboxylase n=1 Tax=Micromonospora echinospora TaxID=1877 RepID=A0A1C4Z6Y0_MICEC|nr:alanine racemase [Micromonospora echinospora]OZV78259.1 diaminopimelate decarboxylase [Micromonospora echinospora]SCF28725.1 diaminopimelate decarboxylase [Micromonospora echinospora]